MLHVLQVLLHESMGEEDKMHEDLQINISQGKASTPHRPNAVQQQTSQTPTTHQSAATPATAVTSRPDITHTIIQYAKPKESFGEIFAYVSYSKLFGCRQSY